MEGSRTFRAAHGVHRPVCGGRCLVAHVGHMNFMPGSVLLFTPPTITWFLCVASAVGPPPTVAAASIICACLYTSALSCLLLTHFTEPGLLPTVVVEIRNKNGQTVRSQRDPRFGPQRPYWPRPGTRPPRRGGDYNGVRKVVLQPGGEEHELLEFRAKVCRETETAVEHFDHFCPCECMQQSSLVSEQGVFGRFARD